MQFNTRRTEYVWLRRSVRNPGYLSDPIGIQATHQQNGAPLPPWSGRASVLRIGISYYAQSVERSGPIGLASAGHDRHEPSTWPRTWRMPPVGQPHRMDLDGHGA